MNSFQKHFLFVSILVFCLQSIFFSQTKIVEIKFDGLEQTEESYLRNFISSSEGQNFDSLLAQDDVQQLRNLKLFLEVNHSVQNSPDGKIITYFCEELITILPIINFGGVNENFWFQLGAVDYNWLGRGNTFGGYYRYYDRHSLEIFMKSPYLFGKHWGLSGNVARLSTIEPAYFTDGRTDYNVDHWAFVLMGRYNFSLRNAIEFGGGYLYERYEKNLDRSGSNAPGPDLVDFDKYLFKFQFINNYIDYYYQYLTGYSNELNLETVSTKGEEEFFWKFLIITKLFLRMGGDGNWAFRLRAGISTNKISPFVPFVLDSYINVRGSGNRVSRGTAELTLNLEYRHTLFDKKWGAFQSVIFSDVSSWRQPGEDFSDMLLSKNIVTFIGLGIRFIVRKFNNFILRLDYGKSVTGYKGEGFVFGAGQYF
jgi:outer membrane protein assembly factor BamA